jgi:hypothetical protein
MGNGETYNEARSCNLMRPSPGGLRRGDSVPGLGLLYIARGRWRIPQMSYLFLAQSG